MPVGVAAAQAAGAAAKLGAMSTAAKVGIVAGIAVAGGAERGRCRGRRGQTGNR